MMSRTYGTTGRTLNKRQLFRYNIKEWDYLPLFFCRYFLSMLYGFRYKNQFSLDIPCIIHGRN